MKTLQQWEDNYPKIAQVYDGRMLIVSGKQIDTPMDVRQFVFDNDVILKEQVREMFKGYTLPDLSEHQKIDIVQQWVIKNLKYTSDEGQLGRPEFWMFPTETLVLRRGDCEDGALLILSLLLNASCDPRRFRLTCGYVTADGEEGGHAYVTYCVGPENEGEYWIPVDWCFYPETGPVAERKRLSERREYGSVWFSFNRRYCWSPTPNTSFRGRVKTRRI
ncbi:MAG: transglutaminase domain-containing protein [Candidatus Pacebacteria bacterium]|nr:transglutaminase domain-containing protein [Candidatus Paceibacterota bacterium]